MLIDAHDVISAMSDEKRLIKHLLEEYEMVGVVGRPVFNTSQTINVQYGLALIQILDLDEKNQVLTTNVWSRYVSNRYGLQCASFKSGYSVSFPVQPVSCNHCYINSEAYLVYMACEIPFMYTNVSK